MTYYLRMRFLLLLLPVIMTVGRPHLLGAPLDPDHRVDLSIPTRVLTLLQSFLDRHQKNQALHGSCQTLPRLSLLCGLAITQLNFHSAHNPSIRGDHPNYSAQAISGRDLRLILN